MLQLGGALSSLQTTTKEKVCLDRRVTIQGQYQDVWYNMSSRWIPQRRMLPKPARPSGEEFESSRAATLGVGVNTALDLEDSCTLISNHDDPAFTSVSNTL